MGFRKPENRTCCRGAAQVCLCIKGNKPIVGSVKARGAWNPEHKCRAWSSTGTRTDYPL